MPSSDTSVKVKWPSTRDVFVNGNYVDSAGATNTPFQVEQPARTRSIF